MKVILSGKSDVYLVDDVKLSSLQSWLNSWYVKVTKKVHRKIPAVY